MLNSKTIRLAAVVTGLAAVTLLASCGGGDDNNSSPTPTTPVPVSNTPPAAASASVDGFIAYLKGVVSVTPVDTQPLDLTGFVAPTDDTGPFDTSI